MNCAPCKRLGTWLTVLYVMATLSMAGASERLRVMVETDAGGDPDDEQSLVRFLLYANEWDVEGIIANRAQARPGENRNTERAGLGIVRRVLDAYAASYGNLVQHDTRYPKPALLLGRSVAGYADVEDALQLIIKVVDAADDRPLWFMNWGTDAGSAPSNLKRALDRILQERGQEGYARFKSKLRLSSDDQFGNHTFNEQPTFPFWVDTFRPPMDGKRWYHRFSALTARAGGFDLLRDVLTGHGPLGALYPTNTTHWQKEGDSMTFLYLVPTGMNDPAQPHWGSWGGRYGPRDQADGKQYFWANQLDAWRGATNRDNTLARWAAALQNDFAARLDWCVKPFRGANHKPSLALNGNTNDHIHKVEAKPGSPLHLRASGSTDPDGDELAFLWEIYPEAGTFTGSVDIQAAAASDATLHIPANASGKEIHVILTVRDNGSPSLSAYRRVVVRVR